ncbi:MAG: hypothetical protein AAFP76_04945 [Bacteroidota bacterium]
MNPLKTPLQWLLVLATITLGYFSFSRDFGGTIIAFLAIFSLGLIYHIFVDRVISGLFVLVISFFILSEAFSALAYYQVLPGSMPIFMSYLLSMAGCVLIFRKIILEARIRLTFGRNSWIIILVIAANTFIAYLMIQLMSQLELSLKHLFLGFGQTLLKLFLLSLGLVSYALAGRRSKRLNLLYWTIGCFFLGETIDIINYTLYSDQLVLAYIFLRNGLLVIGVFAFYLFCRGAEERGELSHTKDFLKV